MQRTRRGRCKLSAKALITTTYKSVKTINVDHNLGRLVVVVVLVAVVAVVTVVVVVMGEGDLLAQPLITKVLLHLVVGLGVVVVVMMMVVVVVVMVVVVLVAVMLEVMLDLVLEALVHELLELDTVLVVLDGTDELVVEMVLQPEAGLVTLQLVLESAELRVVVVVAVVAVARVVVVMTVVVVRVVGMRRDISVNLLSGDLGDGNMGRMLVVVMAVVMAVVMGMNWQIGVVLPVRTNGVVTIVLNVTVVVGSSQGGGKAEDGNGDDLGLHFDCSFDFGKRV